MPAVVIPGRAARGIRPSGPFRLNRDSPQAKGLVAWWPLGITRPTNLVTNQSLIDVNGNVTQTGAVLGGTASVFNGVDTAYTQNTTPVTAAPLTIACWFRTIESNTPPSVVSVANVSSDADYFDLEARSDQGFTLAAVARSSGEGRFSANSTTAFTDNEWYHACGVFASSTSRSGYLNGGGKGTDTGTCSPSGSSNVGVGFLDRASGGGGLHGYLVDVRIYNRALSDAEVWMLYAPQTRWDLYYVPGRRVFVDLAASAGRLSRLTLAGVG